MQKQVQKSYRKLKNEDYSLRRIQTDNIKKLKSFKKR